MNIEEIRAYCLKFHDTTESFPFDEDVLAFKVSGKIFCLTSLSEPDRMNLKCEPEKAIELREQYPCVIPGYHMSKKMWNTVIIDGSVSKKMLQSWIKHSFDEVVKGLPKKLQLQHQTKNKSDK
ncbi:MAG: MmcQ/YjbR family DNA-binding protein [Bacteroidia bacterium]|nr:MmcQ/YjbR family DNA-binding protein [Bacteroidia bacterium]